MPIVMTMKWSGVTPEQYEKLRKTVNWEGDVPKGAQFHVASFDKEGIRVVDLWNSAEDFNSFTKNRLMPAVQQLGVKGEPQLEIYPTHAIFAPAFKK